METLEDFIRKQKESLNGESEKIYGLFGSLLDSMAILPGLFPLYIDPINRKTDFKPDFNFNPGRAYNSRAGALDSEERREHLVYLGKYLEYARASLLTGLRENRAIPSHVEGVIQVQKDIAIVYNRLYESPFSREILQRLPRNVPQMVSDETLPFFEKWRDLLYLSYNRAFHLEGIFSNGDIKMAGLSDRLKSDICREYELVNDPDFIDRVVSGEDLIPAYLKFRQRLKREEKKPTRNEAPKRTGSESLVLPRILNDLHSRLTEIYRIASGPFNRRREDLFIKHYGTRGNDYRLSELIKDVESLRAGLDSGELNASALADVAVITSALYFRELWTNNGSSPLVSSTLKPKILGLGQIVQQFKNLD